MSPQAGYQTIESTSTLKALAKDLNIPKAISNKFNTLYDLVRYFENKWNDSVSDVFNNYYSLKLTGSIDLHRLIDKLTDAPANDSYEFALLYAYAYNQFYEAKKLDIKSRNDKKKFKDLAADVLDPLDQKDLQTAIDDKLNYTIPEEITITSVLKTVPIPNPRYNDGREMGERFKYIYDNFFVTLSYNEIKYAYDLLNNISDNFTNEYFKKGFYETAGKKYSQNQLNNMKSFVNDVRDLIPKLETYLSRYSCPGEIKLKGELKEVKRFEKTYGSAALVFVLERVYGFNKQTNTGIDVFDNMIDKFYDKIEKIDDKFKDPKKILFNYFVYGDSNKKYTKNYNFSIDFDNAIKTANKDVNDVVKMFRLGDYPINFTGVDIFAQHYLFCQKQEKYETKPTLYQVLETRFGENVTEFMNQQLMNVHLLSLAGQQTFFTQILDKLSYNCPEFTGAVISSLASNDAKIVSMPGILPGEKNRSLTVRQFYETVPSAIDKALTNMIASLVEEMYYGKMIYAHEKDIKYVRSSAERIAEEIIKLPYLRYTNIHIPFFPDIYERVRSSASPYSALAGLFGPQGSEMISEIKERKDISIYYVANLNQILEEIDKNVPMKPLIMTVSKFRAGLETLYKEHKSGGELTDSQFRNNLYFELAGAQGVRHRARLDIQLDEGETIRDSEWTIEMQTRANNLGVLYLDDAYIKMHGNPVRDKVSQWLSAYEPSSNSKSKFRLYEVFYYNKTSDKWHLYSFAETMGRNGAKFYIGKRTLDSKETELGFIRTWWGGVIDVKDVWSKTDKNSGFVFSATLPGTKVGMGGVKARTRDQSAAIAGIFGEKTNAFVRLTKINDFTEIGANIIQNEKFMLESAIGYNEAKEQITGGGLKFAMRGNFGFAQAMYSELDRSVYSETEIHDKKIRNKGGYGFESYLNDFNTYLSIGRTYGYKNTFSGLGKLNLSEDSYLQASWTEQQIKEQRLEMIEKNINDIQELIDNAGPGVDIEELERRKKFYENMRDSIRVKEALLKFGTAKYVMPFSLNNFKEISGKFNLELVGSEYFALINSSLTIDDTTDSIIRSAAVSAGVNLGPISPRGGGLTTVLELDKDTDVFIGAGGYLDYFAGATVGVKTVEGFFGGKFVGFIQGAYGLDNDNALNVALAMANKFKNGEFYFAAMYDDRIGNPVLRLLTREKTSAQFKNITEKGYVGGVKLYTYLNNGAMLSVDFRAEQLTRLSPSKFNEFMASMRITYQNRNLEGFIEGSYIRRKTEIYEDKDLGIRVGVTMWF